MPTPMKRIMVFVLLAGAMFTVAGKAVAAGTLVPISSATYDSGRAEESYGVAVDASGNIIVTGYVSDGTGTDGDYCTIKYNPDMVMLASATYDGGYDDKAFSVAVDTSNNNIIVTGYSEGGSNNNFLTIKYAPNLVVLASATYDGGNRDEATGVAVDPSGNIIVTGSTYVGTNDDFLTIKYDQDLVMIASVTYASGSPDYPKGVAVDSLGNIIVTGLTQTGPGDYFTIKYSPTLQVLASAPYNSPEGYSETAYGVAVDTSNNVIVTGKIDYSDGKRVTIKYDPNLVVLASTTYSSSPNDDGGANAVTVDKSGNIIVVGFTAAPDLYTAKYDPNLVLIASATLDGTGNDFAYAVAVDSSGNIIVAGTSKQTNENIFLIKYYADLPPVVSSVSPTSEFNTVVARLTITGTGFINRPTVYVGGQPGAVTYVSSTTLTVDLPPGLGLPPGIKDVVVTNPDGQSATLANAFTVVQPLALFSVSPSSGPTSGGTLVTLQGCGFVSGAAVRIGTFTATGVTIVSTSTLRCVTPASPSIGAKDVTVTLPDEQTSTLEGGFTYEHFSSSATIDPSAGGTAMIQPDSGQITVDVPGGAFGNAVTLSVSTITVPASNQASIKVTNVGMEVSAGGQQPGKDITITVYYRDADIADLEESKLTLARYDSGRWIPVPTVVYADLNKLVGTIQHLSAFAVVQLVPAADLAGVKVYPNPFTPKNGSLSIANLTGEAEIRIYNVAGELVRTLNYTTATGQTAWDGKNDSGNDVASGVYLAFIKSSAGKKIVKIAVER